MAALIEAGEWSTYGDISEAIRGDKRAAQAVGRAVLKFGVSPYPRLLNPEGRLPKKYRPKPTTDAGSDQPIDPDDLRTRFEAEGVRFVNEKIDLPGGYVDARELKRRDERKGHGG
jgi:alkylated DNA nucleotide flippase Atl1